MTIYKIYIDTNKDDVQTCNDKKEADRLLDYLKKIMPDADIKIEITEE